MAADEAPMATEEEEKEEEGAPMAAEEAPIAARSSSLARSQYEKPRLELREEGPGPPLLPLLPLADLVGGGRGKIREINGAEGHLISLRFHRSGREGEPILQISYQN